VIDLVENVLSGDSVIGFSGDPYVITKDGTWVYSGYVGRPLLTSDNEVGGTVFTLTNLSERKRKEEEKATQLRLEATSTLAGGLAHDINNLMVSVLGNAEILQMDLNQDSKTISLLSSIAHAAKRAGELAHQMLAFARLGKRNMEILNLNQIVNETLLSIGPSIPKKITLQKKLKSNLMDVEADRGQLLQAVLNIIVNSAEAIQGAGYIEIITTNVPSEIDDSVYICLIVEDNGVGMNASTLERAFEPFFTTKTMGRGLGLSAVYGIAKNHGGTVIMESEEGQGTRVEFCLPSVQHSNDKKS
ncbi:hypothetical protein K8I28_16845, partial [bacterium]|nr:hypothetical protein [bacterium]